jgi:hypothetical protein
MVLWVLSVELVSVSFCVCAFFRLRSHMAWTISRKQIDKGNPPNCEWQLLLQSGDPQ